MANKKIVTLDNLQYYHEELLQVIDGKQDNISDLAEYAKISDVESMINDAIYNVLNTPV